MSFFKTARRTHIEVNFAGTDITPSIKDYLISLTYTDNEEDAADDLQIKLHDRDGVWVKKWLNSAIQADSLNDSGYTNKIVEKAKEPANNVSSENVEANSDGALYKVIAPNGVNVHSRPEEKYFVYGVLPYGEIITVKSISDGWANFNYSRKNAYVNASYLQAVTSAAATAASFNSRAAAPASSGSSWNIGESVIADGQPQYSSYGNGKPGKAVNNYKGKITYLNLQPGIPYPIHVDYLGWFSESQIAKDNGGSASVNSGASTGKGLKIGAVIVRQNWNVDGEDSVLDCGQFELDNITVSAPPQTVTIKGTSLSYASTIRQTLKSKSWENTSLSVIAKEIAEKNGLACMFLSDENPSYSRVEQYQTSDICFLQKLCHDAGCSLKFSNNILVIFDQSKYEKNPAVKTISYKNGGWISYKLSTNAKGSYTSCHVCHTRSDGSVISGYAYVEDYDSEGKNNQCLEIRQNVSSIAEAENLAKKMLRLHNKFELSASFKFPGDTKLLAGCTVILDGFGNWDGKYIINQAKHMVNNSGYETEINLRRALNGQE